MSEVSNPIKVMVVDDHEMVRVGLTMILNRMDGIKVVGETGNGETAVHMSLSIKPDVILMDLAMPVMDGIQATGEIKAKQPEVKVLMLTTHESEDDVLACLSAGADGYCVKSIGKKELESAVKAVAGGATWLDPAVAACVLRSVTKTMHTASRPSEVADGALSARELEVLQLLVEGLSNPEISQRLHITTDTVKSHIRHILEKMSVSDRTQAAVKAIKTGLIKP